MSLARIVSTNMMFCLIHNMPPKKSSKKSAPRKGRRAPRSGFTKTARSPPNSSKVVEFYDLGLFNCNEAYDFAIAGIVPTSPVGGQATRASIVAPAFGLYRIAQVEYKITPRYDTYNANLGQGGVPIGDQAVEVPKMYWKMNRYGDAPVGFTSLDMLSLGSKPMRLDDNTLTIKYKPNILLANAGARAAGDDGGSGQVKMTPWLSTDSEADNNAFALSTTNHYGHLMYIECAAAGDGVSPICEIQARVIYEFKNPRIIESATHAAQRAATPHTSVTFASRVTRQVAGHRDLLNT